MFSDDLEDKIAAIMRGNFDQKDKPKKSKKKNSLGISSPTSEISEKGSIADSEPASPSPITPATEFTKVSRGATPRVVSAESPVIEEVKPTPVAAPSPRVNATGAIPSTNSLPPIKSSPATSPRASAGPVTPAPAPVAEPGRHSRSSSNAEPLKDAALDAMLPSSDIAALIARLQNSSTDTSRAASPAVEDKLAPAATSAASSVPVTPVAKSTTSTNVASVGIAALSLNDEKSTPSAKPSVAAPVITSAATAAAAAAVAAAVAVAPTPAAATAATTASGATPASLNVSTTSSQPLDDSAVDDMLFGELSRDDDVSSVDNSRNLLQEDQQLPDFATMSDISDIASERSVQSIAQSMGSNFFNTRQKPLSYQHPSQQQQQQQVQQHQQQLQDIKGNSFLSDFDKDSRDYFDHEDGGLLLSDDHEDEAEGAAATAAGGSRTAAAPREEQEEDLGATVSTQISLSRNSLSSINASTAAAGGSARGAPANKGGAAAVVANTHTTPVKPAAGGGGGGRIAVKPAVDVVPLTPVRHASPQPATEVRTVSASAIAAAAAVPPAPQPSPAASSSDGKGRVVRPSDAPSPKTQHKTAPSETVASAVVPPQSTAAVLETVTPRKSPPPHAVIVIQNEGSDIKKKPVLSSGNRGKKPATTSTSDGAAAGAESAAGAAAVPSQLSSPPKIVPTRAVSPHMNKKPPAAVAAVAGGGGVDEESLPHYMRSRKTSQGSATDDTDNNRGSSSSVSPPPLHSSAASQAEVTEKLMKGVSPRPAIKEVRPPSPPPPLHTSAVTQSEATEKLTKGTSGRARTPSKVAPTPPVGAFAAGPLVTKAADANNSNSSSTGGGSSAVKKGRTTNVTPSRASSSNSRPTSVGRSRDPKADFSYSDLGQALDYDDVSQRHVSSVSSPTREQQRQQHPVRVAVRVRPFTGAEAAQGSKRCIAKQGDKLIVVNPRAFEAEPDTIAAAAITMDNKQWAQIFHFNHFLWNSNPLSDDPPVDDSEYADQVDLYNAVGGEIVRNVLSGVSASCFAYGHTGTGKTHSLFGNIVKFNHAGNNSSSGNSRAVTPSKSVSSNGGSNASGSGVGGGGHSSIHAINQAINAASVISPRSGLIPRVMNDIVRGVNDRDIFGHDTKIFFSFLEIYNDKIRDLLSDAATAATESVHGSNISSGAYHHSVEEHSIELLKVREHPVFGPYVENLKKVEVSSPEEVLMLIARGQSNRSTTSTAFNHTSSRSHAVVTLELTPSNYNASMKFISNSARNNETFRKTLSDEMALVPHASGSEADPHSHLFVRVQMVDLAGSEKDSMSIHGATSSSTRDEHGFWNGTRYNDTTPNKHAEAIADKEKNELKIIRRSLSTLGYIIKELAKGAAFRSLPYRDSVLTFLLRDALNGYNHTTMLATISPCGSCYEETLSTLRYAENLCALRNVTFQGEHHSMNSLISIEKDMGLSRQALLDEFARIHSALGQNKPGSRSASRQLLHQTLADPQQRIAKLTRALQGTEDEEEAAAETVLEMDESEHNQHHHDESTAATAASGQHHHAVSHTKGSPPKRGGSGSGPTSPDDPLRRHTITNSDLETLKNSYRTLQGHFMELQVDLRDVKADRDALAIDLRLAKEQISQIELVKQDTRSSVAAITKSFKTAEKEIFEYKALIKRRDEMIERLTSELAAEKQGRLDAEAAYHSRTKDFLARFEQMKKENKQLSANLDSMLAKQKSQTDDKKDTATQIDKLKAHVRLLTTARDSLSACVDTLTNDNSTLRLRLQQLTGSSQVTDYQKESADLTLLVGRLQSDLQAMTQERDALNLMLQQKDSLLKIQGQQADMSIKMLQKRQAQLENGEPSDEYARLLESLRELFTSEGEVILSELMDTERLTTMIRDVRDKMLQYDGLLSMYEAEQRSGAAKKEEFDLRLGESRKELDQAYARIVQLEKQLQQAQQNAPPQFAFSTYTAAPAPAPTLSPPKPTAATAVSNGVNPTTAAAMANQLEVQLRTENNLLREQLVIAQSETNKYAMELRSLKDAHRAELSKVWNTLQELQSVDAAKDKSLQALIADRDRAIVEKDQAEERLKVAASRCSELQREIDEIDADLIAAVELASQTQSQTGGPLALHRVPDRLMHGIARRRAHKLSSSSGGGGISSMNGASRGPPLSVSDLNASGGGGTFGPQSFVNIAQLIPNVVPSFAASGGSASAAPVARPAANYGDNGSNVPVPFFSESRLASAAASVTGQGYYSTTAAAASGPVSAVNGFASAAVPGRSAAAMPQQQQQQPQQQPPQFQFPSQFQQQQQQQPAPSQLYSHQPPPQQQQPYASSGGQYYQTPPVAYSAAPTPASIQRPPQQQQQQYHQAPQAQYYQPNQFSQPAAPPVAAAYHHQPQPTHHAAYHAPQQQYAHTPVGGAQQQIRRPPPPPPADEDKQYEISEKILQRQIEELSEFLDDEAKLKRSRIQARGSSNSLNSLGSGASNGQPQSQRMKTLYN